MKTLISLCLVLIPSSFLFGLEALAYLDGYPQLRDTKEPELASRSPATDLSQSQLPEAQNPQPKDRHEEGSSRLPRIYK